jgi:hypothetical protein
MLTYEPDGEVWGFRQMSNDGKGYWYRISKLACKDEAGRAIARVLKTPFKTFTGDIIICLDGITPPGAPPDPSYPILRRAGTVDTNPDAVRVVMWGHSATNKHGRGYYEDAGVGWFDRQGRAHGSFDLTINTGFRGFIAICPPGVKPPQDPMPPAFISDDKKTSADPEGSDEADDASELL